ncbi:MAG TPA: hypothetical protein VFU55_06150 [Terracidiphilus sp.]|nr:hypothetical protein [Terracidiphilus sp.]
MTLVPPTVWRFAIGIVVLAGAAAATVWLVLRHRPSPEEQERTRRKFLAHAGRLVDGMLLDLYEMDSPDGRKLSMLVFSYRIGGVEYECSQDITALRDRILPTQIRAGFPCSVRYQPGNPHNSIVAAEDWNGLRGISPAAPAPHVSTGPGTPPPAPQ